METFLEITKYILPSLVVFATAYYLLKMYLFEQNRSKELELNKEVLASKIPIKLQSYERLLLFCERIKLSNLIYRLRSNNMTNEDLQHSILISVQKEFEHNMAQQLYTSTNLWNIIKLAKDEILNATSNSMQGLTKEGNAMELANKLLSTENSWKQDPVEIAKKAIKEEAKMILG